MTDKKIVEVLSFYENTYLANGVQPVRWPAALVGPPKSVRFLQHIVWMCQEAKKFVAEGRKDKAFRWLGFIQGVLWTKGEYTIEELANHSRPDVPEPKPVGWYD